MNSIEKKLSVLSRVARELNKHKVVWAVGGSLLLYFKGITSDFADIDVMVAEENADTTREIMQSLGDIRPAKQSAKYKTRYFWRFDLAGIALDVMAGFTIVDEGKDYYFPLKNENIEDFTLVDGVRIPLQSLGEWRRYYELMGRDEKMRLIDAHKGS